MTGDSFVLIDNVTNGSAKDDLDAGTLGGFNRSLNPASVGLVAGRLDGTGNYVMWLDENPVVNPTMVYRDCLCLSSGHRTTEQEAGSSVLGGQRVFLSGLVSPMGTAR